MTSQTRTKDVEDSINLESFIEADEAANRSPQKDEGIVVLEDVTYVYEGERIPNELTHLVSRHFETELLILECSDIITDKTVTLVARQNDLYNEIDKIKEWAEVDSISGLAGQSVPVQETEHNDIYIFPDFDFPNVSSDIDSVKEAYRDGIVEYDDGIWVESEKLERYNETVDRVVSHLRTAFWLSLGAAFILPAGLASSILLTTSVFSFLTRIVLENQEEPIDHILERI